MRPRSWLKVVVAGPRVKPGAMLSETPHGHWNLARQEPDKPRARDGARSTI
jgi:hypothetical protein